MIKDQEKAALVLGMIGTAIEASEQMHIYLSQGKEALFRQIHLDLYNMFVRIEGIADNLKAEEDGLSLPAAVASIKFTLERIFMLVDLDAQKALHKIEYELLPLIEELRMNFYFWGCVYPDKDRMNYYYEHEIKEYSSNPYIEAAEKEKHYKYELSIAVIGFNKLEYTKMCVESLLKHLPSDISYELILVNHGSTDGTKEYFESIHPDKQLDIKVNGGGMGALARIAEGKYMLSISNDVIIGTHAVRNLYRCMESDTSIGWVVPSTPNICNFQSIDISYENMDDFEVMAQQNNRSDPYRWEQRVRLCNPIDMRRNAVFEEIGIYGYQYSKNGLAFPDDQVSAFCRRNGYKLMLVKDAYCHHFGSVTIKEQWKEEEARVYLNGRKNFYNAFGIDPWGTGFCYSPELFEEDIFNKGDPVNVLGINCGMGSNSLKIKEALKENVHNTKVRLYNYTDEERYLKDLKGVSDYVKQFHEWHKLPSLNPGVDFDYIIVEEHLEKQKNPERIVNNLYKKVKAGGYLIVAINSSDNEKNIRQHYTDVKKVVGRDVRTSWLYWKKK